MIFCTRALSIVFVGAAIAACSPLQVPTDRPAHSPQEISMDPTTSLANAMSAEDLGRRIIELVKNLHSADDFSPERLERQTGLKVEFNKEDKNRYGAGGPINENWHYGLTTIPDKAGTPARRLTFTFEDRSADGKADPAPVCGLSFKDYRDALVSAGYNVQRMHTGRNNDFWRFTRGVVDVSLWSLRYTDPDKEPACVGTVDIRA